MSTEPDDLADPVDARAALDAEVERLLVRTETGVTLGAGDLKRPLYRASDMARLVVMAAFTLRNVEIMLNDRRQTRTVRGVLLSVAEFDHGTTSSVIVLRERANARVDRAYSLAQVATVRFVIESSVTIRKVES